jgi:hypothetical protein
MGSMEEGISFPGRRLEQSFVVRGDLREREAWDVGERLGYLRTAELAVYGRAITPPLTPQRLAELSGGGSR